MARAVWSAFGQTQRPLPDLLQLPAGTFFSPQGQFIQPAPERAETDSDTFLFPDQLAEFLERSIRILRHQLRQYQSFFDLQFGTGSATVW